MSLLWVNGWVVEGDDVVLTFAFNKSLRVIRQGCVFVLFWFFYFNFFFPLARTFPSNITIIILYDSGAARTMAHRLTGGVPQRVL